MAAIRKRLGGRLAALDERGGVMRCQTGANAHRLHRHQHARPCGVMRVRATMLALPPAWCKTSSLAKSKLAHAFSNMRAKAPTSASSLACRLGMHAGCPSKVAQAHAHTAIALNSSPRACMRQTHTEESQVLAQGASCAAGLAPAAKASGGIAVSTVNSCWCRPRSRLKVDDGQQAVHLARGSLLQGSIL